MSLIQLTHKLIFVLPFIVLFLGLGCIQDKSIKPVERSIKIENDLNDIDSLHFNYQDTLTQTKICPCEFEEYSLDQFLS